MATDLMDRKVTGSVLVAYDEMIRAWVLEQLRDVGATINEDRVQEMIDAALEEFDGGGVSSDEIKNVIQEMVDNGELSLESQPQFETISNKTFNNAEQIAEAFPVGDTSNVILKNVTINSSPNPETFDNVIVNVTNSADGDDRIIKIVTNDGRELEFSYDSNADPSTATITKTSETGIPSLKEDLTNLENSIDDLSTGVETITTEITNINQTINNLQTNSITEERVQEMIDASVGAAIADSY